MHFFVVSLNTNTKELNKVSALSKLSYSERYMSLSTSCIHSKYNPSRQCSSMQFVFEIHAGEVRSLQVHADL